MICKRFPQIELNESNLCSLQCFAPKFTLFKMCTRRCSSCVSLWSDLMGGGASKVKMIKQWMWGQWSAGLNDTNNPPTDCFPPCVVHLSSHLFKAMWLQQVVTHSYLKNNKLRPPTVQKVLKLNCTSSITTTLKTSTLSSSLFLPGGEQHD